jgi:hypothetical protein
MAERPRLPERRPRSKSIMAWIETSLSDLVDELAARQGGSRALRGVRKSHFSDEKAGRLTPAALSKVPNPDVPLQRLRPTGGWIGGEPTAYAVRARHAEEALTLAVYCHYVLQDKIPPKYTGRVLIRLPSYPSCPDCGRSASSSAASQGRAGTTSGWPARSWRSRRQPDARARCIPAARLSELPASQPPGCCQRASARTRETRSGLPGSVPCGLVGHHPPPGVNAAGRMAQPTGCQW